MSANNLNISGLTIAKPPAVSGVDIFTHEVTATTNLTVTEQDLIHDRILAALHEAKSRVVVIFMPKEEEEKQEDEDEEEEEEEEEEEDPDEDSSSSSGQFVPDNLY